MARVEWKVPLLEYDQDHDVTAEMGIHESWKPRKAGSLLHYERGDYDRTRYGPDGNRVDNVRWVERDYEFVAHLEVRDLVKGRSAVFFTWVDVDTGRDYSMFAVDVLNLMKTGDIKVGGQLSGRFGIVKRGVAYGIEYKG